MTEPHVADDETVPLESLHQFHHNPRRGQVKVIAESLNRLGQYRPVVANRGSKTGRVAEILAGNHTWAAAKSLGWDRIKVHWVDVDDDTAARIVAVDNRAADLGKNDPAELADLLQGLDDLAGTGYTDEDLSKLMAGIAEGDADIDDTPDVWAIMITCVDEQQQTDLLDRLSAEGYDVKAVL